MKMRKMTLAVAIMAVVLLLGTGFSGTVYAKLPEKLDTVGKVQNKINADFMNWYWYEKNEKRLPALSEKNIKGISFEFLKENPPGKELFRNAY